MTAVLCVYFGALLENNAGMMDFIKMKQRIVLYSNLIRVKCLRYISHNMQLVLLACVMLSFRNKYLNEQVIHRLAAIVHK